MDQRAATGGSCPHEVPRPRARRARALLPCVLLAFLVSALMVAAAGCAGGVTTSTSLHKAAALPAGATESEGGGASTSMVGKPVIKIGALFPLTGDLAAEGASALRGMRQAVQEVNDAGGVASLRGALLTLVEADSKGEAASGGPEVQSLVAEGVAAIVGAGQSTVALQATDAAERLQIPFVVSSGAADDITGRSLRYTFRLCPKADWYARDQVAFVEALRGKDGMDIRAVALLHEDGEFGRQTAESQKAYLAKAGIDVLADIEYSPEQADVHAEVLQVKQSGAQALLTATFPSDAALIADDMTRLHVGIPIIDAAGGVLDPSFVADAGDAAENVMSVAETAQGSGPSRSLERALQASNATLDADALYSYQAVWLLATALERARSTDPEALRLALATTALYGEHLVLPQGLLTFDGTGQNRSAGLLVVQFQDGKPVTVWPPEYAQAAVRLP